MFNNNSAFQYNYHGGGGAVFARVFKDRKAPIFIKSKFINNHIRSMDNSSGGHGHAQGGAVFIFPGLPNLIITKS